MTHVSLDGVMQGLGGPDEDRRGGFERGGWALPLRSPLGGALVEQVFQRADAFLLGRWTYETFARYWGTMANSASPIATALNTRPKYVASTTLRDPQWQGTTVLSGDLVTAIEALKAEQAGELQVHGSGTLVRWLLEKRLVDEMILLLYPLIIGQGARLFPATGPDIALDLVGSKALESGVMIQSYRPVGRPRHSADGA